jgi:protein-L-isoaspartate(D-aspartate) O-methyltransferase
LHPGSIPGEASIAAGFNHAAVGTVLSMTDFAAARRNMVDTQLRTYDVTSHALLDAVELVPREMFVPDAARDLAYSDQQVTVRAGDGSTRQLLQTMVLARVLQALDIRTGDKVLDCAGGTGYGAALEASLGAQVVALEESTEMATLMRQTLGSCGFGSVKVVSGKLADGYAADGPYDVIVVHGAADDEPSGLLNLLADGGRLAIVMGRGRSGRAVMFTRTGTGIGRRSIFDAAAQPLAAFQPEPAFRF